MRFEAGPCYWDARPEPGAFDKRCAIVALVLSDNGRMFCGGEDRSPCEPFLQFERIEHKRLRVRRPQPNGGVDAYLVGQNANRSHLAPA